MRRAGGPSSPGPGPGLPVGSLQTGIGVSLFPPALLGAPGRVYLWKVCPQLGGTHPLCLGEPRSQMPPTQLDGWEVDQLFEDLSPGQTVCLCFHWAEGILGASRRVSRRDQAGMVGPLAMWLEASRLPLLGLSFPICLRASLLSTEMQAQLKVSHGLTEDSGAFEKEYLRTLSQVGQS